MINKTQLLNHNERLASIIQTLQGKAAGGGGAALETSTVTFSGGNTYYIWYNDGNGEAAYTSISNSGEITAAKGSLLAVSWRKQNLTTGSTTGLTAINTYANRAITDGAELYGINKIIYFRITDTTASFYLDVD